VKYFIQYTCIAKVFFVFFCSFEIVDCCSLIVWCNRPITGRFLLSAFLVLCVFYGNRIIHTINGLACIAVVEGLDNFRVGFPSSLPSEGAAVDINEYKLCADRTILEVDSGSAISVTCESQVSTRFVIVQSLDSSPERLCIGEVSVYQGGQYSCSIIAA